VTAKRITVKACEAAAICGVSVSTFTNDIRPHLREIKVKPTSDPLFLVSDIEAFLVSRVSYTPPTSKTTRAA
jgi:hypothetical protein